MLVPNSRLRDKFWLGPVVRLDGTVGRAPVRRPGDSGSNPGSDDNVSLKLFAYFLIFWQENKHHPQNINSLVSEKIQIIFPII